MAKLDNKKILACCANGAGSSLMVENAIKKVMTRNGIKVAELRHCPVSEGKSAARNYDVVFCAKPFAKTFEGADSLVSCHTPNGSRVLDTIRQLVCGKSVVYIRGRILSGNELTVEVDDIAVYGD